MGVLYNGFYCRAIYLYGSGTALIPKRFGDIEAITSPVELNQAKKKN